MRTEGAKASDEGSAGGNGPGQTGRAAARPSPGPQAGPALLRSPRSPSAAAAAAVTDPRSIFVTHLPKEATEAEVAAFFARYGPLKGGPKGVALKPNRKKKGDVYAFVHYEAAEAAVAALADTAMSMGGCRIKAQPWKLTPSPPGAGAGGGTGGGPPPADEATATDSDGSEGEEDEGEGEDSEEEVFLMRPQEDPEGEAASVLQQYEGPELVRWD